ncbi:MAG: hypothetical protein UX99_C0007G0001 [Candidatus Amesbacteria bacterium GW2011_GWB1_47_26]|uniref:Uncharacterized protein n=1 Tax=Candidatus Amesbacteria bacterium GW2011_GWC2_45_19 TaxID=1618366 RepID=A0A0G1M2T1_9BACT|nr:MAG: hypothetical protein UX05_C0012G0023 [Candidatus Amesbacteria bacterium GW2011_GWC2_45_19]KKU37941.1 MAG: hypothetical protein UX52_C0014G0018 [Candidatus Amesbacteria bacterium GW2011_GWA1_46_35]KKU69027.1 MAG: hypothetical protein UX93_C0003G0019 [Microgenomates group bacterium GW2011_GWC1_47_20]KKU74713.1 MAG: hypothetical protein UX99_C0007G0001 [Candidatus Amesbacteria bacterium GW2011_GWB1_47_26]
MTGVVYKSHMATTEIASVFEKYLVRARYEGGTLNSLAKVLNAGFSFIPGIFDDESESRRFLRRLEVVDRRRGKAIELVGVDGTYHNRSEWEEHRTSYGTVSFEGRPLVLKEGEERWFTISELAALARGIESMVLASFEAAK